MELGLATFADLSSGVTPQQRMRDLLEEAELAEQVGLDVFAIGEHHRPDFLISSPAVALAAIAARTERIRLSSAVTVLSSDDPVRVFQQFAELDLISGGRAEIMAGRGSFIESFPLFGYDLDDYDELYAEKLDLLLKIRDSERVTWSRPPARAPERRRHLPATAPGSASRVGGRRRLAAVGGARRNARPADDAGHHRRPARALRAARRPRTAAPRSRPVTTPPPCRWRSTPTPSSARPRPPPTPPSPRPYLAMMNRIGRERGWPPSGRPEYDALRSPRGAVAAGSVEQVAEKILFEHELFDNSRYVGQMSVGAVAHADVLRSIELFGTEVAPRVREEVARRQAGRAARAGHRRIETRASPRRPRPTNTARRRRQGGRAHPRALRRVGDQGAERIVQRVRVAGRDQPGGAGGRHLREAPDVGEHRAAARAQRGGEHAGLIEALGSRVGQHDESARRSRASASVGADKARHQARPGGHRGKLHHRPPDDPQLRVLDPRPGPQERLHPLVGAQQAEEQHHRPAVVGELGGKRAGGPGGRTPRGG